VSVFEPLAAGFRPLASPVFVSSKNAVSVAAPWPSGHRWGGGKKRMAPGIIRIRLVNRAGQGFFTNRSKKGSGGQKRWLNKLGWLTPGEGGSQGWEEKTDGGL